MDDVSMDDDIIKWMRCLIVDSGHSIQHIHPQYHIQYQLQKKGTKYKGSYCVTTCAGLHVQHYVYNQYLNGISVRP